MKKNKSPLLYGLATAGIIASTTIIVSCAADNQLETLTNWDQMVKIVEDKLKNNELSSLLENKINKQEKQVIDLAKKTNQFDTYKTLSKKIENVKYDNEKINFLYEYNYEKEGITYYYSMKSNNELKQKNNIWGIEINVKQYTSRNNLSNKYTKYYTEFVALEDFFDDWLKEYEINISGYDENIVKDISLYNTNDLHGNAWEEIRVNDSGDINYNKSRVGLEKTLGYINDNPSDLLLDGGDFFAGSSIANFDKGETLIEISNTMGYDGISVGNHEFDFGSEKVISASQNSPFYSTNMVNKNNDIAIFPTNFIKTIKGDVTVGLFSLMNMDFDGLVVEQNRQDIKVNSLIDTAKKQVEAFEEVGVDLIVGFGHVGNGNGYEETSNEIMEAVPEIDVFVDGHTHQKVFDKIEHKSENSSYIVQSGSYGRGLGINEFDLNTETNSIVEDSFDADILNYETLNNATPNTQVKNKLDNLKKRFDEVYAKTSFTIPDGVSLDFGKGGRERKYLFETNMSNFFSDSQEWKASELLTNDPLLTEHRDLADKVISLQNAGGIRTDLSQGGEITKQNLLDVSPFGNRLYILKVSGKDLKDILDDSSKRWRASSFPCFSSNVSLTFNVDSIEYGQAGASSYSSNIEINGNPIDDNEFYALTISDYVFNGGDNYSIFKDKNLEPIYMSPPESEQWQVLEEYGQFLSGTTKNGKYNWNLYNRVVDKPSQATRIILNWIDEEARQIINSLENEARLNNYSYLLKEEDEICIHNHNHLDHH